eukprot:m.67717 g.67717  ORF g.67717 m.67717 type:complete len:189 (-) comp11591_c0_seq1:409-975(-)
MMNFEVAQSLQLNKPMEIKEPETPRTEHSFKLKYYGFALCKSGQSGKLMEYASRAITTAVEAKTKPTKTTLKITSEYLQLTSDQGVEMATIKIKEVRSFARHREASGKTKFITIMTANKFNNDKVKKYQCFMFLAHSTKEADRLCIVLQKSFDFAAELNKLIKEKEEHDSQLYQLKNSPRLVRAGWED